MMPTVASSLTGHNEPQDLARAGEVERVRQADESFARAHRAEPGAARGEDNRLAR